MLVPSIDLSDGRAVQLRQGRERVLVDERSPLELARYFARFGAVAVVDLDAATGNGDNLELVKRLCRFPGVRVGGGIRSVERARELLRAGAQRVILGTAATPELLQKLPRERVMVALDAHGDEVLDQGWTRRTGETVEARARRLAPYCGSFLCTFVEIEGTMSGLDAERRVAPLIRTLREQLGREVTVAGGIKEVSDALAAERLGADVQIGMAYYTGALDLEAALCDMLGLYDGERTLLPGVLQDEAGQVLSLLQLDRATLYEALRRGTLLDTASAAATDHDSPATYELVQMRPDRRRSALLLRVRPKATAATDVMTYSQFGEREFSLAHLVEILSHRKQHRPEKSFTVKLFDNPELLMRKVMEEAFEVTRAQSSDELIWELADAFFFLLTAAVAGEVELGDILAELRGRMK